MAMNGAGCDQGRQASQACDRFREAGGLPAVELNLRRDCGGLGTRALSIANRSIRPISLSLTRLITLPFCFTEASAYRWKMYAGGSALDVESKLY
jgi:hypothetical protein